jgi:voltage-gated potassium channel
VERVSDRRLDALTRAVTSRWIVAYLAFFTLLVTLAAALTVRIFAKDEFTTFGESVWWAAQTVTTVGYGDVIPETTFSRTIAVLVMVFGVAAVSLITALVTASFFAYQQRRLGPETERHAELLGTLERVERRLEQLERRLS